MTASIRKTQNLQILYCVAEIEFSRLNPQLRLTRLFLDPTGDHLLLCFVPRNAETSFQAELFYLNRKSTKIRQVRGILEVSLERLTDLI